MSNNSWMFSEMNENSFYTPQGGYDFNRDIQKWNNQIDEDNNVILSSRAKSDTKIAPPFNPQGNYYPQRDTIMIGGQNERSLSETLIKTDLRLAGPESSPQFSRHARRLYVGGMSASHTNEDQLRAFLNEVISNCLDEAYPSNHILSVYMNHKKCFAFIELSSIELATACLELDGIVYRSNVLKIQRANEYKPELLLNVARVPLKLNLAKAPFPRTAHEVNLIASLDSGASILPKGTLLDVKPGSVVFVGFPYDEGAKRSGIRTGGANAPSSIRSYFKNIMSRNANPEYSLDLSRIKVMDLGDITPGLALEDALQRLEFSTSEIIRRGGIPLVLGGTTEVYYWATGGLMAVAGGAVSILSVDAFLNAQSFSANNSDARVVQSTCTTRLLLDDTRFCPPRDGLLSIPSCEHKLIKFACQGKRCSMEEVNVIQQRDADIVWFMRDIRRNSITDAPSMLYDSDCDETSSGRSAHVAPVSADVHFNSILRNLSDTNRPIHVHFDVSAFAHCFCPGVSVPGGSTGLSSEEGISIASKAGVNHKVAVFSITGFNPEVDDKISGLLVAEMVYGFLLGVKTRMVNAKKRQTKLSTPEVPAGIALTRPQVNNGPQPIPSNQTPNLPPSYLDLNDGADAFVKVSRQQYLPTNQKNIFPPPGL